MIIKSTAKETSLSSRVAACNNCANPLPVNQAIGTNTAAHINNENVL